MDSELSQKEEDKIINKLVEKINIYDLNAAAILLFENIKPITYIGSQTGRFLQSPIMLLIDDDLGIRADKFFQVFEKRENLEKIINKLELVLSEGK